MATSSLRERYAASRGCQDGRQLSVWPAFQGWLHFPIAGATADVGRRGVKEYRAPEALALIAADRDHLPLLAPSFGPRWSVGRPRPPQATPPPLPPPRRPL